MVSILYLVPLIDTEGPSQGREEIVSTWDELKNNLEELDRIRPTLRDAFDHKAVFSWFLLDWVGYDSQEAVFARRGHITGFHAVFDWYRANYLTDQRTQSTGDGVYFHYHHPPKNGAWGWNRNWQDSCWYDVILGRKVLDRQWFSGVFRAGGYVETNEVSSWLERWFPFDYSNISPSKTEYLDWSEATMGAFPYHPSQTNYQKSGSMQRVIMRGVPIRAGSPSICSITDEDIMRAFIDARDRGSAILAYGSHDYSRAMPLSMEMMHKRVAEIGKAYPDVLWRYANAQDAAVKALKIPPSPVTLSMERRGQDLFLMASGRLFSPQPLLVAENNKKEIFWPQMSHVNPLCWKATLTPEIMRVGAAVVSISADVAVSSLSVL